VRENGPGAATAKVMGPMKNQGGKVSVIRRPWDRGERGKRVRRIGRLSDKGVTEVLGVITRHPDRKEEEREKRATKEISRRRRVQEAEKKKAPLVSRFKGVAIRCRPRKKKRQNVDEGGTESTLRADHLFWRNNAR